MDWINISLGLLAGLALFLYGLQQLVKTLVSVAGSQLRYFLAKLTTNRFTGALSGAIVTAIIQSSSITTVLVVGFVSVGLMNLTQAAGVILGANLGTTITAQIVAFKVDQLALAMIVVGVLWQFMVQTKRRQAIGMILFSLGLLFYGMHMMSEAMSPLRDYPPFLEMMKEVNHPLYGVLIGMLFTALIQSSSATLGIVIVLASNGFLTLPAGIALVLGANIGTTITALLATIGANRDALRAALIHVEFNLIGALIWLPFIPELAEMARIMAFDATQAQTIETLSPHTPREIANAHTIFNFINLLIFLPFIPLMVKSVYALVPLKASERTRSPIRPQFLDESLLETPTLAFDAIKREIQRFKEQLTPFVMHLTQLLSQTSLEKLSEQDFVLQQLYHYQEEMTQYLGKISEQDLSESEQEIFIQLTKVLALSDSLLETLDSDFLQVLHKMLEDDIRPSESMINWMTELSLTVEQALDKAFQAFLEEDSQKALEVIAMKPKVDHLVDEVLKYQAKNLKPDAQRILIFRLEMQLIQQFKRLHTLSKRLARLVITESE